MAMRAAATAAAAGPRRLRALFSTQSSNLQLPSPLFNEPENTPSGEPSTNLFVTGLSKRTTDEGLRQGFAKFGEVLQARVIKDRESGYSKGYGFVSYSTLEEAAAGIVGLNGQFLDGWVIFAEYAQRRASPPPLPTNKNSNSRQ